MRFQSQEIKQVMRHLSIKGNEAGAVPAIGGYNRHKIRVGILRGDWVLEGAGGLEDQGCK